VTGLEEDATLSISKIVALELAVEEGRNSLRDANDRFGVSKGELLSLTESFSLSSLRVTDLEEETAQAREEREHFRRRVRLCC
jgi:hypothetical protein